jgi:hypothetical protein
MLGKQYAMPHAYSLIISRSPKYSNKATSTYVWILFVKLVKCTKYRGNTFIARNEGVDFQSRLEYSNKYTNFYQKIK